VADDLRIYKQPGLYDQAVGKLQIFLVSIWLLSVIAKTVADDLRIYKQPGLYDQAIGKLQIFLVSIWLDQIVQRMDSIGLDSYVLFEGSECRVAVPAIRALA